MATNKKTTKKAAAKRTKGKAPAKKTAKSKPATKPERDPRLPAVGTTMTRKYKGKELSVGVLEDGFSYEGQTFRSLSGLAKHIVGYGISGPVFFQLDKPKAPAQED